MAYFPPPKLGTVTNTFRVGRVRAFLRGMVWYRCYHENGKRHQPRVGPDRQLANQMAAEINAQSPVASSKTIGVLGSFARFSK